MTEDKIQTCPHCNEPLKKWAPPGDSTWGDHFHYVCFNDDCPYFKKGWQWMMEKYQVRASYRYHYDPTTGETGPLPVWSNTAMRGDVIPD